MTKAPKNGRKKPRSAPAREPRKANVNKSGKKHAKSTFAERLQALSDLHPRTDHPVDDSRESIYEGRGE